MPDEFVGEPQRRIDDPFIIHEHHIAQPSTVGQAHFIHHAHIFDKAEGPRWSDIFFEVFRVLAGVDHVHAADGIRVIKEVFNLERVGRLDSEALGAAGIERELDGLGDSDFFDRFFLADDLAAFDQVAELNR